MFSRLFFSKDYYGAMNHFNFDILREAKPFNSNFDMKYFIYNSLGHYFLFNVHVCIIFMIPHQHSPFHECESAAPGPRWDPHKLISEDDFIAF